MNEAYIIALLERLVYNTDPYRNKDFETYIKELKDASSKQSATAVHGDVRARPEARPGPVPGHEQGENVRVRIDPGAGATQQKKLWKS